MSYLPAIACLIPLLGALALILARRNEDLRDQLSVATAAVTLGCVLMVLRSFLRGDPLKLELFSAIPNAPVALHVDGPGMLFALVASSLWLVTSLFAIGYMRGLKEHSQTRFSVCFAIAISCALGAAFAANLLTLYCFYELLSLATIALVGHHQNTSAKIGVRKYAGHLLAASVGLVLPAMVICYHQAGTLDFMVGGALSTGISSGLATALALMLVLGFAKAGLMPLHSWLPGAMVAPTPVSALLHAVAVVKVGVFCIYRSIHGILGVDLLSKYDLGTTLAWIAAFTVLTSSLIALSQDELKRRLAFSTIGQLGYIVLGAALLSQAGATGAVMHVAMHAFGKITLFFCAGAIYVACGLKKISQMRGLGRRMPITMTVFTIGAMSVIGLPPTGGLISKLWLLKGTLQADQPVLLAVFLISSFLNACYFLPIVFDAFFREPDNEKTKSGGEPPLLCLLPPAITAVASVLLFFRPDLLILLAGGGQ